MKYNERKIISEWSCHVCGVVRPDHNIKVTTNDRSAEYDAKPGTVHENVRHCNDNAPCIYAARVYSLKEIALRKKRGLHAARKD